MTKIQTRVQKEDWFTGTVERPITVTNTNGVRETNESNNVQHFKITNRIRRKSSTLCLQAPVVGKYSNSCKHDEYEALNSKCAGASNFSRFIKSKFSKKNKNEYSMTNCNLFWRWAGYIGMLILRAFPPFLRKYPGVPNLTHFRSAKSCQNQQNVKQLLDESRKNQYVKLLANFPCISMRYLENPDVTIFNT